MSLIEFVPLFVLAILCGVYFWMRRWKSYDPQWLVDLAMEQVPSETELHDALRNCTKIRGDYFVDSSRPNKPGSEWQFDRNVTLDHPELGYIVLDILKDGRVGGIEYLGLMLDRQPNK